MSAMTSSDRFELELPDALADVAGSGRSDYLTDILGRTARTSQRAAWASPERWLPVDLATVRAPVARFPWRPMLVVAVVIALVIATVAIFAGSQRRLPPPFGPAANGLIPYSVNGDILVGDPRAGTGRLLVGGSDEDYAPSYSTDGTKIGFLRGVRQGVEAIMVVNADGTDLHAVSASPFTAIDYAQWVPGKDQIIVGDSTSGTPRLEIFEASGTKPPTVILDGARVVWAFYRPPRADEILIDARVNGAWGLYSIHPDGTGIRLLAPAHDPATDDPDQDLNFPSYSPDGSRIYYNKWTPEHQSVQAWVMNADGSDQHRFNASGPECCWWEGEMAPSPDGKWVVMWRVPPAGLGKPAITLYPSDGSGDGRVIGPPIAGGADWLWSPDSTKLLVNYTDAAEGDQGLIDVATGEFTKLPWNADTEPDWQRTVH
jgi:hypothetical protein